MIIIKIANIAFINIALFLALFVWINFYIYNILAATALCSLVLLALNLAYFKITKKRGAIKTLKAKESSEISSLCLVLSVLPNTERLAYICDVIGHTPKPTTNQYIQTSNAIILDYLNPSSTMDAAIIGDIIAKCKKEQKQKAFVIIAAPNPAFSSMCQQIENVSILTITISELYLYNKLHKNISPPNSIQLATNKQTNAKLIRAAIINKQKCKTYLMLGCLMVLMGLLIRLSVYYCIMASVLLVLAAISALDKSTTTSNIELLVEQKK